jgi:hypothetical protein
METFKKCGHPKTEDNVVVDVYKKRNSGEKVSYEQCKLCRQQKSTEREQRWKKAREDSGHSPRFGSQFDHEPTMEEIEAMIAEQLPTMPVDGRAVQKKPRWTVPIIKVGKNNRKRYLEST